MSDESEFLEELEKLGTSDDDHAGCVWPTDQGLPVLTAEEKAQVAESQKVVINYGVGHSVGIA